MLESTKITVARPIRRGEIHACRRSNDVELGRNLAARLAPAGLHKCLPHPFGNGQAAQTRRTLDVAIFGVLNDDLQPLSHRMSVIDSL
jgi:hypothetical protein